MLSRPLLRLLGLAPRSLSCAAALLSAAACSGDAQFTVKYAPGYPKPRETVSVLGVFKDGRMNMEAWDELGAKISSTLGATQCPLGYDAKLGSSKHEISDAVDDYTRANGVTDDLLEQLAPAAGGDLILVLTVAGRPPEARSEGLNSGTLSPNSAPASAGRNMGPNTRRGAGMGAMNRSLAARAIDRNSFELAATLYSTKEHRSVGEVHLGYIGASTNDAVSRFAEKLASSLAGSSCSGWNWDAKIDDAKIRELKDE